MKVIFILTVLSYPFLAIAQDRLFSDLKQEQVTRINIHYPEKDDVQLERRGLAWVLPDWQDYPANRVYVDMLLKVMMSMQRGNVVSREPSKISEWLTGTTVELFDDERRVLATLKLGKKGTTYREAHVVAGDEAALRLVKADIIPAVRRASWGNPWVWRVPSALIQSLHTNGLQTNLRWRMKHGNWSDEDGGPLTINEANRLIQRLASWRAGGVKFQSKPPANWEPTAFVEINAAEATMRLELQNLQNGIWVGMREGMPVQFLFREESLRALLETEQSP